MRKHVSYILFILFLLSFFPVPASAGLLQRVLHRTARPDAPSSVSLQAPADTLIPLPELLSLFEQVDSLSSLLWQWEQSAAEEEAELAARRAVDTLPTDDKFVRVVLYDDHTWQYIDFGRPVIDDAVFGDHWDTENIHAYKDVQLASLPDEVDILLADSLHGAVAPRTGKINSRFMFRSNVGREHKGTDISLKTGDPVVAAFDGKVRIVAPSRLTGGYGNMLVIRHSNGLETYYGHLSKILVDENDLVKAGEIIALGGNTGRSTGPHLHFETRYHGQPFDPERLFDFTTGTLRDTTLTLHKHYFSIYSHQGQTDEESLAASQRVVHTIRKGDTLGALARRYQTTVSRICTLNGIKSTTVLRVGQRLIVR